MRLRSSGSTAVSEHGIHMASLVSEPWLPGFKNYTNKTDRK